MYKCTDCEKEFEELSSLSRHYGIIHNKPKKQLFVDLFCEGVEPTCKCGCGNQVKFINIIKGFREFVVGHSSRIKNNWGHNKKAREKSLATRQEMLEDGTWKPFALKETGEIWNKGLTKETNKSVAQMAETIKNNSDEILSRKERMKKGRLDGTIPTLYGKKHSRWRGGVSLLNSYCHANQKLYWNWKYPILKKANFTCEECGKKSKEIKMHIHHDKIKMNTIMKLICEQNGWDKRTTEEGLKVKIADEVAEYHIQNNVSGKVLCPDCHKQLHPNLKF